MSLAGMVEHCSQTNDYSKEILKKFESAIKRVTNKNQEGNGEASQLTQDELIKLIQCWEPKRDIICLYVRWARQLRRNFNLDLIATLLCLSRQCDYTPIDFLRKVKTVSCVKNQKAIYGITFLFDIPNRKDVKHRERLNKEFLGLSVTLALLQEQVTEAPSILGKTGMRQSGPRTAYPVNIPISNNNNQHVSVVTHPTMEFHKQSSLYNRIWMSINHRWIALYLTEHLFRGINVTWSYQDALVYSFQMMAPCGPGRFEFLSPLAGYCLRFQTQESIESNRTRLQKIWNDPTSFLSFGNSCLMQFSTEAKTRIIKACYQQLHSEIPSMCKQISYQRDCSWLRRWTILRAYTFHFWLEATSNNKLKAMTTNQSTHSDARKKRKTNRSCATSMGGTIVHKDATTNSQAPLLKDPPQASFNGLLSITSSRRTSNHTTPSIDHSTPNTVQDKGLEARMENKQLNMANPRTMIDIDWQCLRLATSDEMQQLVQSFLLIHRLDGIDLLAELSPLEVYSADHLHDLIHCRLSSKPPYFPTDKVGPVTLHIRTDTDCFIDRTGKIYHVAREQSEYFVEHAHRLPCMSTIQHLCQAITQYGSTDSKRAVGQYRVSIGNGGQNWVDGAPCKLHGLQFQKEVEKDGQINFAQILHAIGKITEFTWYVMSGMQQDAHDHPVALDPFRKQLYAQYLSNYLNMDKEVGFEDLTLVVSLLHPVIHQVSEHRDSMNDTLAGYTRTAAFNMVMIGNKEDGSPMLLHLQIICNFRKVIGQYITPFHKFITPVAKHAQQYLDKLHHNLQTLFGGKTTTIPNVFDRSQFFLDDTLPYTLVTIAEEGKHKQTISAEYILTEINVSRTLSLSMFIDPIVKLRSYLHMDQSIELAFACSFLSNPFWFDWCMSSLIDRHMSPDDPFKFGLHPFYDWCHNTIEIFGSWQGGPYNRWSPCGGQKETILDIFGAKPGATTEERQCGEAKLSQVIAILWEHIKWINSMTNCGHNPIIDMPLSLMKANCDRTIQEIGKIASCQFSHFRLGILTTILAGCGLLKDGKHLRNLMYPVKGSASFKHLGCPVGDLMSTERARALGNNKAYEEISNDGHGVVQEDHHDIFMMYLSAHLGFKVYVRDEIECILCEKKQKSILSDRRLSLQPGPGVLHLKEARYSLPVTPDGVPGQRG